MQTSLVPTRAFVLGVETTGLSLVRTDPGNWTGGQVGVGTLIGSQCGVSAPVLSDWLGRTATAADMRAVTPDTMGAVFAANYWLRINADRLPVGVDLMAADHGYNRGAATSAKLLQRLIGEDADGWIGNQTIASVEAWTAGVLNLPMLDSHALQEAAGVVQDGRVGAITLAAVAALPTSCALLACLYAAQVRDYRQLSAAPHNPGWFNRARARWQVASALPVTCAAEPFLSFMETPYA